MGKKGIQLAQNIKRKVKDSVFTHLFQDKAYLLQLYQAENKRGNMYE